jgi:hypothetical protein
VFLLDATISTEQKLLLNLACLPHSTHVQFGILIQVCGYHHQPQLHRLGEEVLKGQFVTIGLIRLDQVYFDGLLLDQFGRFVIDYYRCIHFQIICSYDLHSRISEPLKFKHIQRSNVQSDGIIIPTTCLG